MWPKPGKKIKQIKKKYRQTPVELLANIGLLARPTVAAHCVHLEPEDIELLVTNNTGIVYNPLSNMKLGSGIAPISSMQSRGLTVGLGTDGVASNNSLDIIEEARLVLIYRK